MPGGHHPASGRVPGRPVVSYIQNTAEILRLAEFTKPATHLELEGTGSGSGSGVCRRAPRLPNRRARLVMVQDGDHPRRRSLLMIHFFIYGRPLPVHATPRHAATRTPRWRGWLLRTRRPLKPNCRTTGRLPPQAVVPAGSEVCQTSSLVSTHL